MITRGSPSEVVEQPQIRRAPVPRPGCTLPSNTPLISEAPHFVEVQFEHVVKVALDDRCPANVTMNAGIRNLPINVSCTSPSAPQMTIGTTMPASEPYCEL